MKKVLLILVAVLSINGSSAFAAENRCDVLSRLPDQYDGIDVKLLDSLRLLAVTCQIRHLSSMLAVGKHQSSILRELQKDPNNSALIRLDMEATAEELRYKTLYEIAVRRAESLDKFYEERKLGSAPQRKGLIF